MKEEEWRTSAKAIFEKVQSKPLHYVLNEDHSIRPATVIEWAKGVEKAKWGKWRDVDDRQVMVEDTIESIDGLGWARVAQDFIGVVHISTVFLGIDHGFLPGGPPIVFETMIFEGEHDQDQWRYVTWDEAVRGHEYAVALVKGTEQHDWHDDEAVP